MTKSEIKLWHKNNPYGKRTPEYMDAVLARIKEVWATKPSLRLGQLLEVEANRGIDMFYIPDEYWFED